MSLLLGIAGGAVKIGQKIFGGIKNRREKKIAKKAQALLEQQTRLTKFNTISQKFGFTPGIVGDTDNSDELGFLINPGAGTQSLSSAANALFNRKGDPEALKPTSASVALDERENPGPGKVNPMLLIGGAFVLILLFISKRR